MWLRSQNADTLYIAIATRKMKIEGEGEMPWGKKAETGTGGKGKGAMTTNLIDGRGQLRGLYTAPSRSSEMLDLGKTE